MFRDIGARKNGFFFLFNMQKIELKTSINGAPRSLKIAF